MWNIMDNMEERQFISFHNFVLYFQNLFTIQLIFLPYFSYHFTNQLTFLVIRFGKYRRKLWNDMKKKEESQVE
jgi:hypothetical protein